MINDINRLNELYKSGALTAEEYKKAKAKILEEKKRLPGKVFNYELDSVSSIEIDYPDDLQLTRYVADSVLKSI